MATVWNEFELKRPPLVTLRAPNTAFAKKCFMAINKYLQQLTEPMAVEFEETAALISRLMARRKNSFRGLPGFRAICKLNAALCRLLRLDLPRELQHFRGSLPDVCDAALAGEMPTRSSFEYILVRLQSVYHLHERIRECCLAAAKYFSQLLRSNFFMEFITLIIAAIAKINRLSVLEANRCVKLYNRLRPQCSHFPQVDRHRFLPEDCVLPVNLHLIKTTQPEEPKTATTSLMSKPPPVITKLEKAQQRAKMDVGTLIERKATRNPSTQTVDFSVSSLQTIEDVKTFIRRESKSRKQAPENCITKALKKHEWQAAVTLFERKLLANEHKKALSIFLKFISSKI
ncbi:uncharacterized protein LOC115622530 [Scaptodrosophila lebanonensis]|uniref:Uncharacterized protein LOC115622530 n=1 Tax=Drosophila lebanonensis TaxID=7225 RepID=A0A6J2TB76_DROLE|nr:uncharacterized protein LOC115622530 [Scaptodrosophila lebanonensis]